MKKDIYHQPYFPFLLVGSYLSYCYGVIGLRGDHIAMGVLIFGLWYAHPKARQWLLAFLPFLLNWVAYDMMRAFPNYSFNTVHIADLYAAEKALFGINLDGVRLTPCEFFAIYHHPIFDALGGLFYLSWVPVPMGIAAYLWWQNEAAFRRFIAIFLLTNFIGYIGYYAYPAAPPWYIALHGTEFIANTRAFPAALTRFDAMFGVSVFSNMYSVGSNVFAAMPSLHSASPMAAILFGWNYFNSFWGRLCLLSFGMGVWFSAVYLNHHYVLDVLGGMLCAILAVLLVIAIEKWRGKPI